MIKIHDHGTLREFADRDAVIAHFGLTHLDDQTFGGLKAASDANWPLHATIDPCVLELRGNRVLLVDNTAKGLKSEYRMRCQDI